MMRSLRKMLVAAASVALPFACFLVIGSTPATAIGQTAEHAQAAVVHAVGESSQSSSAHGQPDQVQAFGEIQLVAGTQGDSNRGGSLLRAFGFGGNKQPQPVQHNHQQAQAPGFLSGLFGSSNPGDSARSKQSSDTNSSPEAPDWSGIPYHAALQTNDTQNRDPIRDPNGNDRTARIIRGRSPQPHTVNPSPAAGSAKGHETISRIPTPPVGIPQPRSEAVAATPARSSSQAIGSTVAVPSVSRRGTTAELSGETSSRRSGRRSLDTLDPTAIASSDAAAARSLDGNGGTAGAESIELVPRVARRVIQTPDQAVKAALQSQSEKDALVQAEKLAAARAVAAEKQAAQERIAQIETAEKLAAQKLAAETLAAQKLAAEKLAAQKETAQKLAAAKAASEIQAAQKLAAEKLAAEKLATEQLTKTLPAPSTPDFLMPSQTVPHLNGPAAMAFSDQSFNSANSDVRLESSLPSQPENPSALAPIGSGIVHSSEVDPFAPAIAGTKASFGKSIPASTVAHHPAASTRRNSDSLVPRTPEDRQLVAGETSVASELPGIRVMTFGPSEVLVRQTRKYEIRVENRGAIDAKAMVVRTNIPDWAEINGHEVSQGTVENEKQSQGARLVWKIESLPAGSIERMFVQLRAQQSGTHDLDVNWTLVPEPAVATVRVHEPRLNLTIDGPEEVVYGQSQAYTVRVLNPGDGTAANVVFTLSPNSAAPQSQRIGDIPAGKEAQFEVELTAQDLGDLMIHGLASGDLELRAEAEKTIRVAAAKLEATLTGPELRYQNTEAIYNLKVSNAGTATSEQIVAALRLPMGVKFIDGMEQATAESGTLTWTIPSLKPGANSDYQFRCEMVATGEQKFAFECSGSAAGQTAVGLATRVESIADLVLSISDPPAPAPISSDVTYEIVVRNRGSKAANDVRVVAQFSHGIEPNRIEGHSGELLTGQVVFDPISAIEAGQEIRLQVVAKADRAGHHRFRTEIRSGDTILVAEEATHYMSPQSDRVSRHSSDEETR